MAYSSNGDYEELLQENEEDQMLLEAMEESIRCYEKVEIPCVSKISTKSNCQNDRPSTSGEAALRQEGTSRPGVTENGTKFEYSGLDENGFDKGTGQSWIYPTNYPIRDYQFNIVQCALFKNTLVSLPTGLGKTFIAAVLMYNFYRWFPEGKVLFLAPTRPLVAQQIDSCYKVMGIPRHDTAEMTGQMPPHQREVQWKKCRLFFLTPQSLLSDLLRSTCPVQQIRCVVVDEAHRATGNYAYCQVIQAILPFNKLFRVLALSATPGNDMDAVQQVVKNLLIEHVEVRDESSSDTAQYTNERIVDTIVVKLQGFHKFVQDAYVEILGSYMDQLLKWKLIYGNARTLSKYSLILSRNKFRSHPPSGMSQNIAKRVESDFFLCMSLAHGLELLNQHGLRNLYRYLNGLLEDTDSSNSFCRARLKSNGTLEDLLDVLQERLGETELREPDLNTSIGAIQTQSAPSVYSHPKMEKLRDVIIKHFQTYQLKGEETRAMVFCQYRDTVVEVCHLLARLKPLVKVMSFVGQSTGKLNKGLSQKKQLEIMERFRKGGYNTLISTSIGEEGLDIGEVDLIVCYDAHASPIRLVQRMGRTGRKRQGRIVMLLTEGKENKKYHQSLSNRKSMNAGLINSTQFLKFLYRSPDIIPSGLEPVCYKMFMSMPKTNQDRDVRKMLMSKKGNNLKGSGASRNYSCEDIDLDIPPNVIPETKFLYSMEAEEFLKYNPAHPNKIDFSSDLDWLLNDTETINVSRSCVANDLQALLEFAARRRCDVPLSQTANLASQVCRSELWPSKRKKGSAPQSKGPQRKRKKPDNATAHSSDKPNKQRRLTSLWSGISDSESDFVTNDAELMPPPLTRPHTEKKLTKNATLEDSNAKAHDESIVIVNSDEDEDLFELNAVEDSEICEEDMVDILHENLAMTEHMITKIKELETGSTSCCRFSKMFHDSQLSSLLIDTGKEEKEIKNVSILQHLPHVTDPGYFDELLNPAVWEKFKSGSKSGDSQTISSQKERKKTRYDHINDKQNLNDDHVVDGSLRITDSNLSLVLHCENTDTLGNELYSNAFPVDSRHSKGSCTNDTGPNFDIGISQLLSISPDMSPEAQENILVDHSDVDSNCRSPNILRNELSQKRYHRNNKHFSKQSRDDYTDISSQQSQDFPLKKSWQQCMEKSKHIESVESHVHDVWPKKRKTDAQMFTCSMQSEGELVGEKRKKHLSNSNLKWSTDVSKEKQNELCFTREHKDSHMDDIFSGNKTESDLSDESLVNLSPDLAARKPTDSFRGESEVVGCKDINVNDASKNETNGAVQNHRESFQDDHRNLSDFIDEAFLKLSDMPSKKHAVDFSEGNSDVKSVDSHLNDSSSDKTTKQNEQIHSDKLHNDHGNLSIFVDDAILKWLGSSEDDFDLPSSVENAEKEQANSANTPLSPIISSQRKKSISSSTTRKFRSASTPKPSKTSLVVKQKDENKSLTVSGECSNKKVLLNKQRDDVFDDNSSLEDFDVSSACKPKITTNRNKDVKHKNVNEDVLRVGAAFIQDEAEESREDRRDSSDGENTSGLDELDDSFVDDEEHTVNESVDIHAHYLQSVKSPINGRGQFKMKEVQTFQGNVYSQDVTEGQDSYEEDSFCVDTSSENSSIEQNDTLDIIEAALKRKKKRKPSKESPQKQKGRKRICVVSSSSDEEMEVLKNLPLTQVTRHSSSSKNIFTEVDGKEDSDSSISVKNDTNKKSSAVSCYNVSDTSNSNDNSKGKHPPTNYLNNNDDDDCVLIDDLVDSNVEKPSTSSLLDNSSKSHSRHKIIEIYDNQEELLRIHGSKRASESRTGQVDAGQSGVRKQLQFCDSNSNKKTLMTHFFTRSSTDAKSNVPNGTINRFSASSLEGIKGNSRGQASSGSFQNFEVTKEVASNSEGKLTVISSSRQVVSAPEIITALKSRHHIFVLVHPIHVAHFIVSSRVGVVRTALKDISKKPSQLLDAAKSLKTLFQRAFVVIEHSPSETGQKGMWPSHCIDLAPRLRTIGVHVLYSDCKTSTADLLANLCCREFSCGHSIKLPKSIRNVSAVVHFLEGLPGINTALAFNICCHFKSIVDFISKCKSVPEIRQMLGINRETARKIYFLLQDVL